MTRADSLFFLFFGGFLLLLELLHPLNPGLVTPLEQRRRVDVRVSVVLVIGNLNVILLF